MNKRELETETIAGPSREQGEGACQVEVTPDLIAAGASVANGYTRRQVELLGLGWPPPRGWKRSIVGTSVSREAATEFVRLAGAGHSPSKRANSPAEARNWCGAVEPVDIFLYVLALQGDRFYVGLTSDLDRRLEQHFTASGAEWTRLHRPVRVVHSINTGTRDRLQAEAMENEATVALMMSYGIEAVRGGHYSQLETADIEPALRAHGAWDRIKQAQLQRVALDLDLSWSEALDSFLDKAQAYYAAGAPESLSDDVFAAGYRLTRFPHWRPTFAPALGWAFWSRKGILPVLLSFKLGRPIASRLSSPYEVLAAAMSRGRNGEHPHRHLFLLAWQAYQPPTTSNQARTVSRFMECLQDPGEPDRQYDDFVSVLFPETRHLLRAPPSDDGAGEPSTRNDGNLPTPRRSAPSIAGQPRSGLQAEPTGLGGGEAAGSRSDCCTGEMGSLP